MQLRRGIFVLVVTLTLSVLMGCSGLPSGPSANSQPQPQNPSATAGTLAVTPASLNFGNVQVGSSASLKGTLSAASDAVAVSSAAWSGSGYSVSGVTFPVTIPAGKTVNYTVT